MDSLLFNRPPAISTLIFSSGEHLFITDTPEAFSAAVLELLQDNFLADNMRKNAFQLVQTRYSWQIIWKDLLRTYEKLGE